MDITYNNNITNTYDEYDSVCYGQGKVKKYWNPKTKVYKVWESKTQTALYRDTDYKALMDGKYNDIGRLTILMQHIDNDNCLCYKHRGKWLPVNCESQLMDLIDLKPRAWISFKKKLDDKDILKYVTIDNPDGTQWHRYYINPLCTMRDRGISITCYKLFKESLDPLLPAQARINLERHLAEEEGIIEQELTVPVLSADEIFHQYILDNKPADTWIKAKGMVRGTANENVWFSANEVAIGQPRTTDNVVAYRNLYIDIDAGRDADGNYYSLDEVAKRKLKMDEVICALPTPTMVVDTRNGYQVWWSLGQSDHQNAEKWNEVEQKIVKLITIADKQVKDSVRVLRMPYSVHHKTGLDPYQVTIVAATPVRYSLQQMEEIIDNTSESITAVCEEYLKQFPTTEKTSQAVKKSYETNYEMSDRISDIANLTMDTFTDFPEASHMTKEEAKQYYCQQDLGDFLQIDNPAAFDCIFHKTPGGDGKSATIYGPSEQCDKYRYVCHCIDKYYDIIACVMHLADCDYQVACQYLARIFNVWIV